MGRAQLSKSLRCCTSSRLLLEGQRDKQTRAAEAATRCFPRTGKAPPAELRRGLNAPSTPTTNLVFINDTRQRDRKVVNELKYVMPIEDKKIISDIGDYLMGRNERDYVLFMTGI